MHDFLNTSVEYLKGVGPKRAELLRNELNIFTFGDLISHYPFRYVDKSKFFKVREINSDAVYVQLKGKISSLKTHGKQRTTRVTAIFKDESGEIELVWFKGIRWILDFLKSGKEYIVFGKPSKFNSKFNIVHPEIEEAENKTIDLGEKLQPVYSSTEKLNAKGFSSKGIAKIMKTLMVQAKGSIYETLSDGLIKKLSFISKEDAIINIHFPKDPAILKKAELRLKFEELFYIQLGLLKLKLIRAEKYKGHRFSVVGDFLNNFYHNNLPFELTNAQKKVIKEIRHDTGSGYQMNRLLQGDVGSGKTLVALMTILIALDNGCQACLMAPTEILANQHFATLNKMLDGLGVEIELLTGSTKKSKRKILHEKLQSGELHILIGTHALVEDTVIFKNLGFVVIDEQHRFGVAQRAKLWKKNTTPPHILVMTATPIPRTLAMTLYGDLDYSVIDELPPGRQKIKTYHYYDSGRLRVFEFIRKQIKSGRQVYIVYPLIKESETLDLKDLMDGYESVSRDFPLPDYSISIVHGKMKAADKEIEMQRFINSETQIMVSTTVIEVGVDVPNASVMIIENAERFGLSQLHQLRGRVGRGADQSFCILMTGNKVTNEGKLRIETMVRTTDGFDIADVDLKLRGPGDLQGTQQSGILDLKIADIIKDEKIIKYARQIATEILDDDPNLEKEMNRRFASQLKTINKNRVNWGLIS